MKGFFSDHKPLMFGIIIIMLYMLLIWEELQNMWISAAKRQKYWMILAACIFTMVCLFYQYISKIFGFILFEMGSH